MQWEFEPGDEQNGFQETVRRVRYLHLRHQLGVSVHVYLYVPPHTKKEIDIAIFNFLTDCL